MPQCLILVDGALNGAGVSMAWLALLMPCVGTWRGMARARTGTEMRLRVSQSCTRILTPGMADVHVQRAHMSGLLCTVPRPCIVRCHTCSVPA